MNDKNERINILKKIQTISLNILKTIDNICKEEKITYSLAYGTMLGAVRHKGFIPWDDDIDLMMTPEEYERFIRICETKLPNNLKIVYYSNNSNYPLNFAKIVDINTTFVEVEYEGLQYPQGVSVDIFPTYRIRNKSFVIKKMKYKNTINCLLRMAYTGKAIKKYGGGKKIIVFFAHIISKIIGLKTLNNKMIKRMEKEHLRMGDCFLVEYNSFKTAPYSLFESYSQYQFEDSTFLGVSAFDEYLKDTFGDYMQLPPIEERIPHHIETTCLINLDIPCIITTSKK